MEFIKKNINKIVIIIVLIFIITFIYNYTKDKEIGGVKEEVVAGKEVVAANIITVLNELRETEIDESFFREELGHTGNSLISFSDLEDFSDKEIPPKEKGKKNPFVKDSLGVDDINLENSIEEEVVQE